MTKDQLKSYCEAELENIEKSLIELFNVFNQEKDNYTIADLAAMATFVHNFYNGIENVLKRIMLSKEKEIEKTSTWHKNLLQSSLNSGIIDQELFENLSDYLSFRHFFVHGYGFTLKWEALKPLVVKAKQTFDNFKLEIIKEL